MYRVLLMTLVWGFSFVATRWALAGLPPLWLTAARFGLAVLCGLPMIRQLRLAFAPGMLLAAILILQTLGLKYTSVANNSFITTLYVVLVPLMGSLWHRRAVPLRHWLLVAVAVAGTALICGWQTLTFNVGDLLTLGCAVAASAHMLVLEAAGPRIESAFRFNLAQSAWATLVAVLAAAVFEGSPLAVANWTPRSALALAFLVGPCTLIAYAMQVQVQRTVSAAVLSLLFLLESPFASAFGYVLLGEKLSATQVSGAALILIAAAGAAWSARPASVVDPVIS